MTKPRISVVIDTYNHEKYIEQCVRSAVEQDFPAAEYEIIVVDDGSTDRTAEIAQPFAPRVRVLRKKNGGQASAFNAGVAESRGEIVAFLDGDDWFAPGKLSAVMRALDENPDTVAATHGFYEFREETGQAIARVPGGARILGLGSLKAVSDALDHGGFLLVGGLTIRRKMLDRILPLPEQLVFCADAPIAYGALAERVCLIEAPLFYYRHHRDNFFAMDSANRDRRLRKNRIHEQSYAVTEKLLLRLGVDRRCARSFLYPGWINESRGVLQRFGGNSFHSFRTEVRACYLDCAELGLGYRLFKYGVVGLAALLLPPRVFYRAREWYGQNHISRARHRIFGGRPGTGPEDIRGES